MFFKLFYIFFILILANCQNYDENLVNTAVNISQSSYCLSEENTWDCLTCNDYNIYENHSLINGELAIYGYNKAYNYIFIGFRGSTNLENWITNIHFSMIYPYSNNIGIEKGFYNLFESMKIEIYNNIKILSKKYNSKKLLITGHSLGGAISTLLNFDVLYNGLEYKTYLITFGSPRVGNQNFVNEFNKHKSYSFRITHNYDIVPHLPQELLHYNHIQNEIWYNDDNSKYVICNDLYSEDDSCSNSCAPTHCTSIDDHMYYMNITMGSEGYC